MDGCLTLHVGHSVHIQKFSNIFFLQNLPRECYSTINTNRRHRVKLLHILHPEIPMPSKARLNACTQIKGTTDLGQSRTCNHTIKTDLSRWTEIMAFAKSILLPQNYTESLFLLLRASSHHIH